MAEERISAELDTAPADIVAEEQPVALTEEQPAADAGAEIAPPVAPDYVSMTLDSGVAPLEVRYSQINSCYRKLPVAYRAHTFINSVTMGVLTPEQYAFASDGTERGVRLARWNIEQAISAVRAFERSGRHVQFVTARCPARLALVDDLYQWMKSLLDELDFHSPEKICLEFPQSLLFEDEEKVRLSILNMKLLNVRTMMSGCGADDCPVANLLRIPLDFVLLAPSVTTLIDNRNKSNAILSLIGFLRSLPVEIIAEGVCNDNQISALSRSDCFGYIPSTGFSGNISHGPLRMVLTEAIHQHEEEF